MSDRDTKPGNLLDALEDLLAVAYGPDETSADRVAAAARWFDLLRAERRGASHRTPLADPALAAHEDEHRGHVAQVLVRKYGTPHPIPPDERFPEWAGRPPKGWRAPA